LRSKDEIGQRVGAAEDGEHQQPRAGRQGRAARERLPGRAAACHAGAVDHDRAADERHQIARAVGDVRSFVGFQLGASR
jgi:hypothetical protein